MKENIRTIFGMLAIVTLIALWLTNADWLILFAFFFVVSYITFSIIALIKQKTKKQSKKERVREELYAFADSLNRSYVEDATIDELFCDSAVIDDYMENSYTPFKP